MKLRVEVTQRHITEGLFADCNACPLALALKDAGFPHVWVGDAIWSPDDGFVRCRRLPAVARDFVHRVDRYWQFQGTLLPFSFEVNVADRHIPQRLLSSSNRGSQE